MLNSSFVSLKLGDIMAQPQFSPQERRWFCESFAIAFLTRDAPPDAHNVKLSIATLAKYRATGTSNNLDQGQYSRRRTTRTQARTWKLFGKCYSYHSQGRTQEFFRGGGQDLQYCRENASEGAKRPSGGRVWEGGRSFCILRLKLNDLVHTLGGFSWGNCQ